MKTYTYKFNSSTGTLFACEAEELAQAEVLFMRHMKATCFWTVNRFHRIAVVRLSFERDRSTAYYTYGVTW